MQRYMFVGVGLVLAVGCGDSEVASVTGSGGTVDTGAGGDAVEATTDADVTTDPGPGCFGVEDETPCDDENPCTEDDRCDHGVCVGGTNVICDTEDVCRPGTCDPKQGCVYAPADDGHACQVACFSSAQCVSGVCEADPDTKIQCPQPTELCVASLQCDTDTGLCTVPIQAPEGTDCDSDQDVCTLESCDAGGACQHDDDETCETESANNPCWSYVCTKKGGCTQTLFVEGNSCNDGNACTSSDACTVNEIGQKACLGTPLDTDDYNPCTSDSCVDGAVIHAPIEGVACEILEGECVGQGTCAAGLCVLNNECECLAGGDCDDGLDCTADACLAGACENAVEDGFCVTPNGCVADGAPSISAPCKVCDAAQGKLIDQGFGAPCDDGNPCTISEVCQAGLCQGGVANPCDDGNVCTTDSCDVIAGCTHAPNSTSCDDGLFCTVSDVCKDTQCAGAAKDCSAAGGACETGICDEANDGCAAVPAEDGVGCNDGNPCTADDACSGGLCLGAPYSCNDGDPCTTGTCIGDGTCVAVADGVPCDDGNPCTSDSGCVGGECLSEVVVECDDENPCTADSCCIGFGCVDECVFAPVANGVPCDDGDICTREKCFDGECAITQRTGEWIGDSGVSTDILVEESGGYAVVGWTDAKGAGQNDGRLLRLDGVGEIVLDEVYGSNGDDRFWGIAALEDDYVVVGERWSSENHADGWVMRLSTKGEVVWETLAFKKGPNTPGDIPDDRFRDVVVHPNGAITAIGETTNFKWEKMPPPAIFSDYVPYDQVWYARFSPNGSEVWRKQTGKEGDAVGHAVIVTKAGDLVLAGGQDGVKETMDGLLQGRTEDGITSTFDFYGLTQGHVTEVVADVAELPDGALGVLGYTAGKTRGSMDLMYGKRVIEENKQSHFGGDGGKQVFDVPNRHGGTGHDEGRTLLVHPDGGVIAFGFTQQDGVKTDLPWMLRMTDTGQQLWSRTFEGVNTSRVTAAAISGDGDVVAVGATKTSYTLYNGQRWLLAMDRWGRTSCDPASPCHALGPSDCADDDICTTDACSDAAGGCGNAAIAAVCDDGNLCTVDVCDPVSGCSHTNLSGDEPCPGGTCQSGHCIAHDVPIFAGQWGCAIQADGLPRCWGMRSSLKVYEPDYSPPPEPKSVVVTEGGQVKSVSGNCVLANNGNPWCWKFSNSGFNDVPSEVKQKGTHLNEGPCLSSYNAGVQCWKWGSWIKAGFVAQENFDRPVMSDHSSYLASNGVVYDYGGWAPARRFEGIVDFARSGQGMCAIQDGGTVVCTGNSVSEDLQNVPLDGIDSAVRIDHGGGFACAVLANGTVACWGDNIWGELGTGETSRFEAAPVLVEGLEDVADIALGKDHSCAYTVDAEVYCWGMPVGNTLGNDYVAAGWFDPSDVDLAGVTAIDVIDHRVTAELADGSFVAWGQNNNDLLGVTTGGNKSVPAPVGAPDDVAQFEVGCFLTTAGELWCTSGSDDTSDPVLKQTQEPLSASSGPLQVGADSGHLLFYGDVVSADPQTKKPLLGAVAVGSGNNMGCALLDNGDLYCIGGQWGSAAYAFKQLSGVVDFDVGYKHACAINGDKEVHCVGINESGEVGGSNPVLTDAIDVAVARRKSCAITTGGDVYCWGKMDNDTSIGKPILIEGAGPAKAISTGTFNTCAITTDDTVRCWGVNHYGCLGIGKGLFLTPLAVPGFAP